MPRGARRLPDECLRRLAEADLILHCGDFVTAEVYEELRELGPLEAVHGNMDDDWLARALPETRVVEVEQVRIGMVHIPGPEGGRAERLAARFPGCAVVLYGHTHRPDATEHEGTWILNPGSPTERRSAPAHSMLVLEIAGSRVSPDLVRLP